MKSKIKTENSKYTLVSALTSLILALALTLVPIAAQEHQNESLGDVTIGEAGAATDEVTATDVESIFAEIYTALCDNADEIFSILSFIGTLIVGFAYKKGLIPLLSGAVKRIGDSVEKLREDEASNLASSNERIEDIKNQVVLLDEAVNSLSENLSELGGRLESKKESQSERENMRLILTEQIEMLYDIFMASSLPQFEKEAVGERINKMKEALRNYEVVGEKA